MTEPQPNFWAGDHEQHPDHLEQVEPVVAFGDEPIFDVYRGPEGIAITASIATGQQWSFEQKVEAAKLFGLEPPVQEESEPTEPSIEDMIERLQVLREENLGYLVDESRKKNAKTGRTVEEGSALMWRILGLLALKGVSIQQFTKDLPTPAQKRTAKALFDNRNSAQRIRSKLPSGASRSINTLINTAHIQYEEVVSAEMVAVPEYDTKPSLDTVGGVLYTVMERAGITQRQLSDDLHWSCAKVIRKIHSQDYCKPADLSALLSALNARLQIAWTENPTRPEIRPFSADEIADLCSIYVEVWTERRRQDRQARKDAEAAQQQELADAEENDAS